MRGISMAKCGLCGEPMPPGEEMFKYHGYSGDCPNPPLEQKSPALECTWECDSDGNWETDCGEMFILNEGTPVDNSMKFCCYCGKPLREAPVKLEEGTEE